LEFVARTKAAEKRTKVLAPEKGMKGKGVKRRAVIE
jgi:hypothetical protein